MTQAQKLSAFAWSSYPHYLKPRSVRPPWLRVDRPLGEHGIARAGRSKAERLVRVELARLGWSEGDLARRRKGDPAKVRIALRLRRETTMTLGWIAQRLHLGVKTHLSRLAYWHGRQKRPKRKRPV